MQPDDIESFLLSTVDGLFIYSRSLCFRHGRRSAHLSELKEPGGEVFEGGPPLPRRRGG